MTTKNENKWLERTESLLGSSAMQHIVNSRICVFGLGAVGSYAVEALTRAGISWLRLVDFDVIRESNLNRQLLALRSTIGRPKALVARDRVLEINPSAHVDPRVQFAHADTLPDLLADEPDLVVDAVDSLSPKVEILTASAERDIPVFSALGAATRLDASRVRFGPLFSSKGCPLGRHLRKRLRRRGVTGDFSCVFSDEDNRPEAVLPPETDGDDYERGRRRNSLGSLSTVTGLFGLRLAHEAILRLADGPGPNRAG